MVELLKVKLTSTKILISFTKLKIISEVVLLLPNTDLLYQVED
jgi:hypothetical protein